MRSRDGKESTLIVPETELRNKLLPGTPSSNRSLIQGWEATEAGSFQTPRKDKGRVSNWAETRSYGIRLSLRTAYPQDRCDTQQHARHNTGLRRKLMMQL